MQPLSDSVADAEALFRATVDNLQQAIYLYRPIWCGERIVDLEIVYCNAAARALPFTDGIVEGALASRVFEDPELAIIEAEVAWLDGQCTPYYIERNGFVDGVERSTRFEIRTRRVAEMILQTSTDFTVADDLQRTESQQRLILDTLSEGVTLLAPVFDESRQMTGTRVLYANQAAHGFRGSNVGVFEGASGQGDELDAARRAWETDAPAVRIIDRLGVVAGEQPGVFVELEATRVGGLILQVVRDMTEEMRSTRGKYAAEGRFRSTIEALSEAVGIWDPIRNTSGEIIDFVLRYANPSLSTELAVGTLGSNVPADLDFVEVARQAFLLDGRPMTTTTALNGMAGNSKTLRTSLVQIGDEVVSVATDITDIARHAAELEWFATHQRQSRMLNLDGLLSVVQQCTQQTGGSFALIWISLTELDTIRPTFGFAAGDAALLSAASRVTAIAEQHGAIATQPEDSALAVLVPDVASGAHVQRIADDMATELSKPFVYESMSLLLGPAIGCTIGPLREVGAEALVRRSKTAAWSASMTGANVIQWRAELDAAQLERASLLGEFAKAMASGELFFEFQPKLDVLTHRLVGAEALVRWTHPDRGRLSPEGFVEGVEASVLCRPFTMWAILQALSQWAPVAARFPGSKVAVNVPVRLITDLDFLEQLADELVSVGADPSWLQIELSERGLIGNIADVQAGLEQISMLGVSVALDDFGTGQSSLAFLRKLPLDEVKVDRSFITNLQVDVANRAIVTMCVAIARTGSMRICAEGVETEEEMAAVTQLGCDYAQGFLLGRPMTIAALLARPD